MIGDYDPCFDRALRSQDSDILEELQYGSVMVGFSVLRTLLMTIVVRLLPLSRWWATRIVSPRLLWRAMVLSSLLSRRIWIISPLSLLVSMD